MSEKQVDASHYRFERYMAKPRWCSLFHQLEELARLEPERALEVGPGPGTFKAAAASFGLRVETLDLDPELHPDHVGSVLELPFTDGAFDVACAFQVLEHFPFEESQRGFRELCRVARRAVLISLPDVGASLPISTHLPLVGPTQFFLPIPSFPMIPHRYDGQHHWELNKWGYSVGRVLRDLTRGNPVKLERQFRVPENPYHHFFVFSKR